MDSHALNQLALEKSLANTIIEEGVFVGFDDALDDIPDDQNIRRSRRPRWMRTATPLIHQQFRRR
jgi:hypothetical protein